MSTPSVRRGFWVAMSLCAAATACGGAQPGAQRPAPSNSAVAVAASVIPSASSVPMRVLAERPPPPEVRTPLAGEPNESEIARVSLVPERCADLEQERRGELEAALREMRRALAESYRNWASEQPICWEQFRADARQRAHGGFGEGQGYGYGYGTGSLGLSGVGRGGGGAVMRGAGAVRLAPTMRGAPRAGRASRTNVQVEGVDEADLVKTDDRFLYLAMNGALRIVDAATGKLRSTTKLAGEVRQLFVEGDRAVVYASTGARRGERCNYGYDCRFAGDGTGTRLTVFELGERDAPRTVRELELSGSLMAARRIGNAIHTVVADGDDGVVEFETWPAGLETCGTPEQVVRAKFARLARENERRLRARRVTLPTLRDGGKAKELCAGLLHSTGAEGRAYTTLASFDLRSDAAPVVTSTVRSRPGAVFASGTALYVAVTASSTRDEHSVLHRFQIGSDASTTRYTGSGIVPGHVLNQFAMDEWYGYLRVATSRGRVPDPNVESVLSVLAVTPKGGLARVGAVKGIAPGEDIRSVRFDGDRGYIVTFKKTDPLFVLDLWDPARPKVLGELKIPGFSTYLHRLDPGHLLSIGFDANDHGDFAYFDGVLLQLFDVTRPTEPKLMHREKIGTRGSSSEALTQHLAFNFDAERGLLAVPMTECAGGADGRFGSKVSFSGLYVYAVDLERGFTRKGGVQHGGEGQSCNTWWSQARSQVKRSVFFDDLVYSIASDRLKLQRLGALGQDLADLGLGG